MKSQTIIYLLKVIICSSLFLLYFWVFLRNKRCHNFNRLFLLISVLLSLVLPLTEISFPKTNNVFTSNINLLNVTEVSGGDELLNNSSLQFNWMALFSYTIYAVSIISLCVWVYKIYKILRLRQKYPVKKFKNYSIVFTDLPEAPFSFFNNVYWRNDLSFNEDSGRQILNHELVHVKQFHSLDKLFMQSVIILFWINPFFWIIKNELFLVHEFIADENSIEDKTGSSFSSMLLYGYFGKAFLSPVQPFFYSPVKRRLRMILKQDSKKIIIRKIMALPLIFMAIVFFSFQNKNENTAVHEKFVLAIDAGHGGSDVGATGAEGLIEKDINLKIARRIQQLAIDFGIEGVLIRKDDIYMSPKEKVELVKANKKINVLVSIHVDDAKDKDSSGMVICIANNNDNKLLDQSKLLGSSINSSLSKKFEIKPELVQRRVGIWILQANIVPAVLIECGFINNARDVKMLTDEKQIDEIARNILSGVAVYANNISENLRRNTIVTNGK